MPDQPQHPPPKEHEKSLFTSKKSQRIIELEEELALLTTYTRDTVYRLRYDTMEYEYISPAVERLLGYSQQDLKEIRIRDLINETRVITDTMKLVHSFEQFEEARKRGETAKWQADYLLRRKDGTRIWVSDISYPWFSEKGEIIGSIGSMRDITERVEAEQRSRDELERMSTTDTLTRFHTRGYFFARLDDELKRLQRSHEDLSLLIIDLDHFKKVNNDFGQKIGDLVIQEVSKLIGKCLRETDIGARLGGEEFGIMLPDTPASGAYWVAERIRSSIAKHIFEFGADEYLMGCTVSVGVASARFDQKIDANTLYALADNRLFIAKRTGRDRVSMDELVEKEDA